jgi:spermidine synthase
VAGRFADRIARPFLWYGILEGIIGIWSLALPFMFEAAIPLYKVIWQNFHLSTIPFSLIRFGVAAAILLPPTTCMGATLPLLSRFVTSSLSSIGDRVGTLYSVNTLGAVAGAILAGFFLLPNIGLEKTTIVAIISNLILLTIVLLASRSHESGSVFSMLPKPATEGSAEKRKLPAAVVAAMFAFAVSGAIALIYEVAWTRTLLMVIGSSTYAFTVMLATFLIGIFAGSFVCARFVDKTDRPLTWLAFTQLLLCGGGLLAVYLFNFVPYWNMSINQQFIHNPNASLAVRFILAGSVLLPITLCLGAIFPLVVKTCTNSLEEVGKSVGTVYSANTLGAIVGAFLAGFVIIPAFGAEKSLVYASIANLVIAAMLAYFSDLKPSIKYISIGGTVAAVFLVAVMQKQIWDPVVLLTAQGQRRLQTTAGETFELPPFDEWRRQLHAERDLMFWEDGACATVGVMYNKLPKNRSLLTNGHVDASDSWDMANQVLLAAYSMVFHPQMKNVAVVGWGSGVTTGTVVAYPGVEKVTSIEIEPAVLRGAKLFNHVNLKPEESPKNFVEFNDARNYLLATNEKFDCIISEPSNPWQAGVCNLFTKEYFKVTRERLKENGVFCAWLQFQEVGPNEVKHVLAALQGEYKYVTPLWSTGCMMLLATDHPLKLNVEAADKVITSHPGLQATLEKVGIDNAVDVLSNIICTPEVVKRLTQGVSPNSDDRNYLEYNVGKTYENQHFQQVNEAELNRDPGTPWEMVNWGNMTASKKAEIMTQVAEAAYDNNYPNRALAWATQSYKTSPNAAALIMQAIIADRQGKPELSQELFAQATELDPNCPLIYLRRAAVSLLKNDVENVRVDARKMLAIKGAREEDILQAKYLLARSFTKVGSPTLVGSKTSFTVNEEPAKVLESLGDLPTNKAFVKKHPDVLLIAGMANMRLGNLNVAEQQLRAYVPLNPQTVIGWRALGTVLFQKGDQIGGAECWRNGLERAHIKCAEEVGQAAKFATQNKLDEAVTILQHAMEYDPGNLAGRRLLIAMAKAGNQRADALLRQIQGR